MATQENEETVLPDVSMVRTNIYLTRVEHKKLKSLSMDTCMPAAEHVRRALDAYLEPSPQKKTTGA